MVISDSDWYNFFYNLFFKTNWLPFATFVLAGVVAYTNYINSIRDRKVHIADKRQEWVNRFRELISEISSLYRNIRLSLRVGESATSTELRILISELNAKTSLVLLMFDADDPNRTELSGFFSNVFAILTRQSRQIVEGEGDDLTEEELRNLDQNLLQEEQNIIRVAGIVISEQRSKISTLDNSDILI
ncbi:hypothetical protein GWK08_08950 [Leptobacterium flavescens]|uniref:Uncharacterized protein n=1 Tax=Leptobacterium flavescens TaxID=472055 RepID=A0A6P0ULX6_9FLAO|nr:hypothetical protein [Leptobacterium flavescens]NER13562.1 hypothetical protein [Leptobacterium flavescens]